LQKDDLLCGNLLHHSYRWKWKLVKPLPKLLLFFKFFFFLQNDYYTLEIKEIMSFKKDDNEILLYFNFYILLVEG